MAISVSTASSILRNLVLGGSVSQGSVYLGLLTRLPDDANHCTNNSTTGYQEVPAFDVNDNPTGYVRLLIGQNGNSATGVANTAYFPSSASWDSENGYTRLTNSGDGIQMHNILPEIDETWDVVGFGLFDAASGGNMKGYGQLVDARGYALRTPVTITGGSVPIFYKGGLTIILTDQPAEPAPEET